MIRTFEKLVFNGYTFGLKKISLQKGDVSAEADFDLSKNTIKTEETNKAEDDKKQVVDEDLSAE